MRQHVLIGVLLMLVTTWVYADLIHHEFVYEDAMYLSPHTHPLDSVGNVLSGRLLARWTYSDNPVFVHVGNLWLHLLSGLLVWCLAVNLRWPMPWAVAGLFLLHPISSEAVLYGAGRGDVLSTFWILGAVVVATSPHPRTHHLVLLGLLAVLSKETGFVVVPLLALAWWFQDRLSLDRRTWLILGVCLALPLAPILWRLNRSAGVSAWAWVLTQATATCRLLDVSLTGTGLSVDPFVDYPWRIQMASFAFLAWIAGWIWWQRQAFPRAAFAVGWIVVSLLTRFLVRTPGSVLNEHQFRTASIGMMFLMALWLDYAIIALNRSISYGHENWRNLRLKGIGISGRRS